MIMNYRGGLDTPYLLSTGSLLNGAKALFGRLPRFYLTNAYPSPHTSSQTRIQSGRFFLTSCPWSLTASYSTGPQIRNRWRTYPHRWDTVLSGSRELPPLCLVRQRPFSPPRPDWCVFTSERGDRTLPRVVLNRETRRERVRSEGLSEIRN